MNTASMPPALMLAAVLLAASTTRGQSSPKSDAVTQDDTADDISPGGADAPPPLGASSPLAVPAEQAAPLGAPAEGDITVPPLDDAFLDLIGAAAPADESTPAGSALPFGWAFFGAGGIRLELSDPTFDSGPDAQAGITVFGRVGLRAPLGRHEAVVAIGDGAALGNPWRTYPVAALGLINEVSLTLRLPLLGREASLRFGRFEVEVADGRLVGNPKFIPRGNLARDGVLAEVPFPWMRVRAGALYLGPYEMGSPRSLSGVAFVDATAQYDLTEALGVRVVGYGIVHQDGTLAALGLAPVSAGTVGTRLRGDAYFITAHAGADAQIATHNDTPLEVPGYGVHLDGNVAIAPHWKVLGYNVSPLFDIGAEATAGEPVSGTAFRSPAGKIHGFLGTMDLITMDNVLSAYVAAGARANERLTVLVSMRGVGLVDPVDGLDGPGGSVLLPRDASRTERLAFGEVDAVMTLKASERITIDGMYGVALYAGDLAGRDPEQRLYLQVRFAFDSSEP